jgi:hypothetical protein
MALFEIAGLIQVTVKGWLVRNDQVLARRGGAVDYIERGHHGDGDPGYGRVRVSCFECVDRRGGPGHAYVFLDAFDDGLGGERRFLRG